MAANPLARLAALGQAPWYDYITRDLFSSGALARLIREDSLQGMTSNPTIFEKAIGGSTLYDEDIRKLSGRGHSAAEIFEAIAVSDVQSACDVFRHLYEVSDGVHGLVSLEVSPTLAHDPRGTLDEARRLWGAVDRPNLMIKIPGTEAGLAAIRSAITEGMSVNVTLLFSVERYARVIEAYLGGLEQRVANGHPVDRVRSVASFFVSRLDSKVDPRLDAMGDPKGIRGSAAIANACRAYALFEREFAGPRWQALESRGALVQRPLWASTSTKDPRYPDVYYVEALIAPHTVNTLPPATFDAYRDHGDPAVRIREGMDRADGQLAALAESGISLDEVTAQLESEGVASFAASYHSLLAGIEAKAGALAGA